MTGAPADGSSNGVLPPSATGEESRGESHAQSAMTQELRNSDPGQEPDEDSEDEKEAEDDNPQEDDTQAPEPDDEPDPDVDEPDVDEPDEDNDDNEGGGDDPDDDASVEAETTPASPAG